MSGQFNFYGMPNYNQFPINNQNNSPRKCKKCQKCVKNKFPCKNPCPLKPFCDSALAYTCNPPSTINNCLPKISVTTWKVNYLVSNQNAVASHYDQELVQPRGIVIYNNQLWVTDTMSDRITNYDLFGNTLLGPILVRLNKGVTSFPSGLAVNCSGGFDIPASNPAKICSNSTNFIVPSVNGSGRPATLATATKTGDVCVFNATSNPNNTYTVINNKLTGQISEYTGLAIVGGIVYLADFYQGNIGVFNGAYVPQTGYPFVDNYPSVPIPADFAPYNIVYIAPYLYVVYAQKLPGLIVHHVIGAGAGFISVFNLDGSFVRRFYSNGVLNAPWSIIPAPCECGIPPGSFLVGNEGDGRINIFSCDGTFLGPMLAQSGLALELVGLQCITPYYTSFSEIFFGSSDDIETIGILGSIVKDQVIQI